MSEVILTPEGLEIMKKELEYIQTVRLPKLREKVGIAFLQGGKEHQDAKEEKAFYECRVDKLQEMIVTAKIIYPASTLTAKRLEVTTRIIALMDAQNAKGLAKYGTTIDQAKDADYDWRLMAMEELIDLAQYQ